MNRISQKLAALFLCTGLAVHAAADTVTLKNGRSFDGVVLTNSALETRIRTDVGTMAFYPSQVAKVTISKDDPKSSLRLATWETCVGAFAKKAWGGEVSQIPATVIDKGALKFVPYMSHRSGAYEMNIYGDPHAPACVEIGIYDPLLNKADAKANCRAFIKSILGNDADRQIVDRLKVDGESVEREGLTIEVTPPTAEDAYGGWWVSVYSTKALDSARATTKELEAITVPLAAPSPAQVPGPADDNFVDDWTPSELARARKPAAPPIVSTPTPNRVPQTVTPSPHATGGAVYVRGYTRKDGTYVQPHTRSAPRR